MKKDPVKRAILYSVVSLHLFFLFYMQFSFAPKNKQQRKPLIVKTVSPSVMPKEKSASSVSLAKQTAKESAPTQKKTKSEPISPKSSKTPTPAPVTAKKAPPIADKRLVKEKKKPAAKSQADEKRAKMSQKLLQDLEESLSKLEAKPEKKKGGAKKFDLPDPVTTLHSDTPSSSMGESQSGDYHSALIGYLKETLNLPEYGEVKIQLVLKQDGSVVNLVVLKTESEKNRRYLETSLPHLKFPQLQGNKKQETFVVTFCNEI